MSDLKGSDEGRKVGGREEHLDHVLPYQVQVAPHLVLGEKSTPWPADKHSVHPGLDHFPRDALVVTFHQT